MLSFVALIAAVLFALTVEPESLLWLGLTLFTAGCLPVALAFMHPVHAGAAGAVNRLTAHGRSVVALHVGSFCAQTGLLVTLIALIV
jgi:hypothetical protein